MFISYEGMFISYNRQMFCSLLDSLWCSNHASTCGLYQSTIYLYLYSIPHEDILWSVVLLLETVPLMFYIPN
jgi:hypothetical protein